MTWVGTHRRWIALALAVAGTLACVWLAARTGIGVLGSLWSASEWLPLLLLLEAGRVAAEAIATRFILARAARSVPLSDLLRAQLTCSALATVLPVGRGAGEAAKASLLAARIGLPAALSVAAGSQILTLSANGLAGVVGGVAAFAHSGANALATSCFAYGSGLLLLATLFALAARSRALSARLDRLPFARGRVERFTRAMRENGTLSAGAIFGQLLARLCQALQLVALAHASGQVLGLEAAPLLLAVYMLGATAGDFVPAQLGTLDAAFLLAARPLGIPEASAIAVGITLHALQLVSAVLCALGAAVLARGGASGARTRKTVWASRFASR